jgi:hypothetical protein
MEDQANSVAANKDTLVCRAQLTDNTLPDYLILANALPQPHIDYHYSVTLKQRRKGKNIVFDLAWKHNHMKRQLLKTLSLIALIFSASNVAAQSISWSSPLAVAATTYKNRHPRVAVAANDKPVVLWGNNIDNSVYFTRWTGSTFATPTKINPMGVDIFADTWAGPDLAAKGDTVYVVYKAEPEDTAGIYLLHSYNGGASFGMPMRVDAPGKTTRFPTVATDATGQAIVGYMKFLSGFSDARWVVRKSTNWGMSFSNDTIASGYNSEPVCDCCPAAIATDGNRIAMLYRNDWNDKRTIWAGISSNTGTSFPQGLEIDNTGWTISACPSSGPDGVIIGDTLYSVFMSNGSKVYYSKASITANQSTPAMLVTESSAGISNQNYPRIASDGNTVIAVWPHLENSTPQIGMLFTTNIQNGFPAWEKALVGTAGNTIMNADVAVKNGIVHLVWQDMNNGSVMYRKGVINTTGISNQPGHKGFVLAPVPTDGLLNINLLYPTTSAGSIKISDVTGRIVLQKEVPTGSDQISFATSGLSSGQYQLSMLSTEGVLRKTFTVRH